MLPPLRSRTPGRITLMKSCLRFMWSSSEEAVLKQSQHLSYHCRATTPRSVTRLFGTKLLPGNPPGLILIENGQEALADIDEERLRSTMERIRDLLGYHTYDVNLYLVEDEFMKETNRETRGINKPTDILSFPFHRHKEPGVLEDPLFDIPDMYCLGEMMIDVPYVIRTCEEDKDDGDSEELSDDRGVSGAMANVYDIEDRINMLVIHGMLHLVGHDHEDDDEYEIMVSKEEEILKELGMWPRKS